MEFFIVVVWSTNVSEFRFFKNKFDLKESIFHGEDSFKEIFRTKNLRDSFVGIGWCTAGPGKHNEQFDWSKLRSRPS